MRYQLRTTRTVTNPVPAIPTSLNVTGSPSIPFSPLPLNMSPNLVTPSMPKQAIDIPDTSGVTVGVKERQMESLLSRGQVQMSAPNNIVMTANTNPRSVMNTNNGESKPVGLVPIALGFYALKLLF